MYNFIKGISLIERKTLANNYQVDGDAFDKDIMECVYRPMIAGTIYLVILIVFENSYLFSTLCMSASDKRPENKVREVEQMDK